VRLVSLVLAAGSARRFGSDKLSAEFRSEPLVHHAIRAACAAPVQRVIVVASPGLDIGNWEGGPPVSVVRTANEALSTSLKAGVAEAGNADGAFVFLGDMPLVPHDEAVRLAAMLGENYAVVPRHDGLNGHPVLFARRAFADIASLEGDEGAGRLLNGRADVAFDACPNECIHLDVDWPEDISRLEAWGEAGRAP
jgi:molybdenum cofactor cytidylyltransferase